MGLGRGTRGTECPHRNLTGCKYHSTSKKPDWKLGFVSNGDKPFRVVEVERPLKLKNIYPKILHLNPWNLTMLLYLEKGSLQMSIRI